MLGPFVSRSGRV